MSTVVQVSLPYHLRTLARVDDIVEVDVSRSITVGSVLDALEMRYPMLRGTIRDHVSGERRPFIRFFACEEDFSLVSPDTRLPSSVAQGVEPFLIIGAIAGG